MVKYSIKTRRNRIYINKKLGFLSLSAVAIIGMTGCGSSSDGSPSDEPVGQDGKGYYIDAAVEGVRYICGSKTGVTGSDGSFNFQGGLKCNLFLDTIPLREYSVSELVNGKQFFERDISKSRVLQTLDMDQNPSNGIVIDDDLVASMIANGINKIPETEAEFNTFNQVMLNNQVVAVTENEAMNHLISTATLNRKTFLHCENDGGKWIRTIDYVTPTDVTYTDEGEVDNIKYKIEDGMISVEQEDGTYASRSVVLDDSYIEIAGEKFFYSEENAQNSPSVSCDKINDLPPVPEVGDIEKALAGKTFYQVETNGVIKEWKFNSDVSFADINDIVLGTSVKRATTEINEEEKTLVLTIGEDIVGLTVESISDESIKFTERGFSVELLSSLDAAQKIGIENFKGNFTGKTLYTGYQDVMEEWSFSNPFGNIDGFDGDGPKNVSVSLSGRYYIMSIDQQTYELKMSYDIDSSDNRVWNISFAQTNTKLFYDKSAAEDYFNLTPPPAD